jgi:hypothetical protein
MEGIGGNPLGIYELYVVSSNHTMSISNPSFLVYDCKQLLGKLNITFCSIVPLSGALFSMV